MDQEIKKTAWEKYKSNPRQPTKQIAKAVARENDDVRWQEVNEYITTRIVKGKSKRRTGIITAAAAAVILGTTSVYLSLRPVKKNPIAKTAGLEIRKDRRVSISTLAATPGVKRFVKSNSNYPDVLYVLNHHPQWFKTTKWNPEFIESFEGFCTIMNHVYGVGSIVAEGVEKVRLTHFLTKGSFTIPDNYSQAQKKYISTLQNILKSADWQIYFGKDNYKSFAQEKKAVKQIHQEYERRLTAKLEDLLTEATTWEGNKALLPKEAKAEVGKRISPFYAQLHSWAEKEIKSIITPEKAELIYKEDIIGTNRLYAEHCFQCKKTEKLPVIVLLGTSHGSTFPQELEKKGLTYAVIQLEGSDPNIGMDCSPETLRKSFLELAHPDALLKYGAVAENNRWRIKREK